MIQREKQGTKSGGVNRIQVGSATSEVRAMKRHEVVAGRLITPHPERNPESVLKGAYGMGMDIPETHEDQNLISLANRTRRDCDAIIAAQSAVEIENRSILPRRQDVSQHTLFDGSKHTIYGRA
ncbi:hypothetical protein DTO164E3_1266 [Paecilomyces variotii]|nr:hypothetical protein DTO164E3_1266 [Paecilomyces variotii]